MDKLQLFSSIDKQFKKAAKQREEISGLRELIKTNENDTELKEYLEARIKDHWNKLDLLLATQSRLVLQLTQENAESQIFLDTFRKDLHEAKVKLRELDELTKNELKGN